MVNELQPVITPTQGDQYAREKLYLAEQASEGSIKILPGKSWGLHYPTGAETRNASISALLSGAAKPSDVADSLKPDALLYDAKDLEALGLSAVSARVRDTSAYATHYDYQRFADFVSRIQGTQLSPAEVQSIYDGIAQNRIRKKLIDAYGHTGRQQLEGILRTEAETIVQQVGNLSNISKVTAALKANWLAEDLGIITTDKRDEVIKQLSPSEVELYERLRNSYQQYVRNGDQNAYEAFVNEIKGSIPKIPDKQASDESLKELEKELEKYKDEAVPPVTPGDPAIPPDDHDEYNTPQSASGESKEQILNKPFFEITPSGTSTLPLTGYYASGRKSYYDIQTKTWSKRKQLFGYTSTITGTERQTISGTTNNGVKSIPIPNGYRLDMNSLTYSGAQPVIQRDQNGSFYITTDNESTFSIDFLKEGPIFTGLPVADDTASIYNGQLLPETEALMKSVTGSTLDKAELIRNYLLSKHFYPQNLEMAQALQLKLRTESSGDTYIQNLENSEFLECYSANTLYIAMARKIGIPARLVIGHKIDSVTNGKAIIDSTTGHAWAEIWDGAAWRRMDATPRQKQEDQSEQKDSDSPGQQAQDGGIERQDPTQETDQPGKQSLQNQQGEVTDKEMHEASSQFDNAKEFAEQMKKAKQDCDQQISDAQSFKDLERLLQESSNSELFNDMKQDIAQKIQAKEKQMKDRFKNNIDEMADDGFLDEEQREELVKQLEEGERDELDKLQKKFEEKNNTYNEYIATRDEVMPEVDRWFEYFVERLPRQGEVEVDEDSLTRQGAFNKRSVMRARNLLFGSVKNPRVIKPAIKPRFLASVMTDVSRSMEGEKLAMSRKLLVFYNELFSRIGNEFGYIRYANYMFSDKPTQLKTFDQDYDSPERYEWEDGTRATIKSHLMGVLQIQGGTNMLPAIQKASADLMEETQVYPEYASAFYFIGDGKDTADNSPKIKEFLKLAAEEGGFGKHMVSAIMLGGESQRQVLANIFGDENTTVAADFEALIEQSMYKFDEDIQNYLRDKVI